MNQNNNRGGRGGNRRGGSRQGINRRGRAHHGGNRGGYGDQRGGHHLNSGPHPFAPPAPPPGHTRIYYFMDVPDHQLPGHNIPNRGASQGYQVNVPHLAAPIATLGSWAPNQGQCSQGDADQGGENEGSHSQAGRETGAISKSKARRTRKQEKRRENQLAAQSTGGRITDTLQATLDEDADGSSDIGNRTASDGATMYSRPSPGIGLYQVNNRVAAAEAYDRAAQEAGQDEIDVYMAPPPKVTHAREAERNRSRRVVIPTNFIDGPSLADDRQVNEVIDGDGDVPMDTCGSCGRTGHVVIECCYANEYGVVEGCGCCNGDHVTEKCELFPKAIAEQVALLVNKRSNLPPLASPGWYPIMYEYMFEDPMAHPENFPWTPKYAADAMLDPEFVAELGEVIGKPGKHVDPATASWDAAKKTFGGEPANLKVALAYEETALKEGKTIVSDLRPSRILWNEITEEEKKALKRANKRGRV